MNLSHPRVIQMVTDSLRYWVQQTHVDGFRFDLGTILAREPNGFDNQSGFLKACSQDPVLGTVKLIAEPWDCGPGGYQVGRFPPGWAEWNDKFRDSVRDFWRGDGAAPALRRPPVRLRADRSTTRAAGRGPCINFVTAHDGFTLNDVVTYNEKHNEANGEEQPRRHLGQPVLELRRRGTDGRSRNQRAARAPDAQYAGDAAALARHADAAGRRRVRPHAARQQQCLLPGQRDQLGRTGDFGKKAQA